MFNRSLFNTFFICSGSSNISSSPEFWERNTNTDRRMALSYRNNQRIVCPRLRCGRTMSMVVLSFDTEWVGPYFVPHIQLLNCITASASHTHVPSHKPLFVELTQCDSMFQRNGRTICCTIIFTNTITAQCTHRQTFP